MIFVFGGSYQGKLEFVKRKFGVTDAEYCTPGNRALSFDCPLIYAFHEFTYGCECRGEDALAYIRANRAAFADKIVISDDISRGLVPTDETERAWRETNGRCCNQLAAWADEVYTVFCGIGQRIK